MEENTPASGTDLSLSAAILAPLNAIFEAQVHAARSFLNFVLQMGFKHRYTKKEIEALEKNPEQNEELLTRIKAESDDREKITKFRKRQAEGEELNDEELDELKRLLNKLSEFHSLRFTYVDDQANEHLITIPNISLIPVKPLAIDDAKFSFEMAVNQSSDYSTIRRSAQAEAHRPWFLIEPRQLKGNIVSKEQANKQAAISIEINIKSTDVPAGLNKLLASMNESSRILPKEISE